MKKSKLLVLSLLAVSAISLTSCGEGPQGEKGETGAPGEKGATGDQGTPGKDGKNGSSVLNGEGAPKDTLGSDGDSYIDYSSFDYYVKENGKWVKKGNIKGAKGETGETGEKGETGETGEKGETGNTGSSGSRGPQGDTAWANTILPSDKCYIVPSIGSTTKDTKVTFTININEDTKSTAFSLLIDNETVDCNKINRVNDKKYTYETTMKDNGFVVQAKFFDTLKESVTGKYVTLLKDVEIKDGAETTDSSSESRTRNIGTIGTFSSLKTLDSTGTTSEIKITSDFGLNLNGHNINLLNSKIVVSSGASLDLSNSVKNAEGATEDSKKGVIKSSTTESAIEIVGNTSDETTATNSSLSVGSNVSIEASAGTAIKQSGAKSSITIKEDSSVSGAKNGIELSAGTLNIEGGEVKSTATTVTETTESGGKVTDVSGVAIAVIQSDAKEEVAVTVSGGTVQSTSGTSVYQKSAETAEGEGTSTSTVTIKLNGGTVEGGTKTDTEISYDTDDFASNPFKYDETEKAYLIKTAEHLKKFRDLVNRGNSFEGKTIKLMTDIDLNNENWEPINYVHNAVSRFKGFTFDGNNHTISNLKVDSACKDGTDIGKNVGLFGMADHCTIQKLNVNKAYIYGVNHVGVIAGDLKYGCKIDNCSVKDATVIANPSIKTTDKSYNGDKVGVIAGFLSGQTTGTITNCTVDGATLKGYRDMAIIVGHVEYGTINVSDNTVKGNIKIIRNRTNNGNDKKYPATDTTSDNVHEIIGRQGTNLTLTELNNKYNEATIDMSSILYTDGFSYNATSKKFEISNAAGLRYFRDKMNALYANGKDIKTENDSFANTTVCLTANIDLQDEEWTPILRYNFNSGFVFDGQGYTVSNFKVTKEFKDGYSEYCAGFFGALEGTVKNLNVYNATIEGNANIGGIVGDGELACIEKCKVTKSTITGKYYEKSTNTYDGSKNVGGIVGYSSSSDAFVYVKDCVVDGCKITGYRCTGGVIGTRNTGTEGKEQADDVTGNTVKNTTIYRDKTEGRNYESFTTDEERLINFIIGRDLGVGKNENNTYSENVTIQDKVVK